MCFAVNARDKFSNSNEFGTADDGDGADEAVHSMWPRNATSGRSEFERLAWWVHDSVQHAGHDGVFVIIIFCVCIEWDMDCDVVCSIRVRRAPTYINYNAVVHTDT